MIAVNMLAARLSTIPLTAFVSSVSRPALVSTSRNVQYVFNRGMANQGRTSTLRRVKPQKTTLKERIMAPAGDTGMKKWISQLVMSAESDIINIL